MFRVKECAEEETSVKGSGKQSHPENGYVPPKCLLTFNGLHGVISQKIIFFITAAEKMSSPT
jgi:hypothetical protein